MLKRMSQDLDWTDMFCGAGGSAQGVTKVPGTGLKVAGNHWRLAVETHSANFPDAAHDIADISNIHPSRWPRTALLWASPECTNHTSAKNHEQARAELRLWDPEKEAERSRVTMFDVPRFAEYHDYQGIIVENVVEARSWKGFDPWLQWMHNMGYDHHVVYWNSGFQPYGRTMLSRPAPQSRDRMYTVFWKRTNRRPDLDLHPACWCHDCGKTVPGIQTFKSDFNVKLAAATARETKTKRAGVRPDRIRWGLYKSQYIYRCPECRAEAFPWMPAALNAIDWSMKGRRIGDRETPLAKNTLARIRKGLERYASRPPIEMLVQMDRLNDPGSKIPIGVDEPMRTQTARANDMLVQPGLIHANRAHGVPRDVEDPMQTFTTGNSHYLVQPFIATLRGGGMKDKVNSVEEPLTNITANGNHHMLVAGPEDARVAFVVRNNGDGRDSGWATTPVDEPLRTIATLGAQSLLQVPDALVDTYHGTDEPRPAEEPLTTQTAVHRHAVVEYPQAYMVPSGGTWADRAVPTDEPAPTLTTRESYGVLEVTDEFVADCLYRMLEPKEIGAGMAFDADYKVLGSKRDKVAQYGNAVTPPVAELIGGQLVESLL